MTSKTLVDFMRSKDSDLYSFASTVIKAMKDNPKYPGAVSYVTDVEDLTTGYAKALAVSEYGGRFDKALKNNLKKDMKKALKRLCLHVNVETPGDILALLAPDLT